MVRMILSLAVALTLSSFGVAVPPKLEERADKNYLAKYDDLSQSPAGEVRVDTYQGLHYDSIFVITAGLLGVAPLAGVAYQSSYNAAGYALTGNVVDGKVASITPTGSNTFSVKDLYFGCAINSGESIVSKATPCTITLVGYNTAKQQVFSRSYDFNPGNSAHPPMAHAVLSNVYAALSRLTLETTNTGPDTVTLIDNLSYTIRSPGRAMS